MLISSSSKIHIFRKQKSPLLTSNELLLMLTKTNNQSKQKIKNIMTYKVYTHRRTHTYVYIPFFHITIKVNVCFSINIYSAEIVSLFWVIVDGCGGL